MKKLTLFLALSLATSGILSADDNFNKKVESLIKERSGKAVKVLRTDKLKSTPNLEVVVIEVDGQKIPILATSDAKVVVGVNQIFFAQNEQDSIELQNIVKMAQGSSTQTNPEQARTFLNSLNEDEFIILRSKKPTKKITYVVADPNCGACQNEIANNLEKKLLDSDIFLLPVAFLGSDSAKKIIFLKTELGGEKNTNKKLAMLKKVYNHNFTLPAKYVNSNVEEVQKLTNKVGDSGIDSVPFIIGK